MTAGLVESFGVERDGTVVAALAPGHDDGSDTVTVVPPEPGVHGIDLYS